VFDYLTYTLCYVHNGEASTQDTVRYLTKRKTFPTKFVEKNEIRVFAQFLTNYSFGSN